MVSSATACIDVLFSDEELANSNTSGSNGYREVDNLKLRFLMSEVRISIVHEAVGRCEVENKTLSVGVKEELFNVDYKSK